MGIAQQFEQIIKKQLRAHAAWFPITNPYKLGDFGMISNGIFNKMGNIQSDFGVQFQEAKGPDASIDFTSDSTTVLNFTGGAQVTVIPQGAIDAKVVYRFNNERSFLIKSPSISVSNIENIHSVLNQLKSKSGWQRKFIIVHQTYFAHDAVVISTIDRETEVAFSGNATALQKLDVGNASVQLNVNRKLGLVVQGKEGVIALGLVRMKTNFLEKDVVFLGPDEEVEPGELNDSDLQDDV